MSEKPEKRLIIHSNVHRDRTTAVPNQLEGWMEYLGILGAKGIKATFGAVMVMGGVVLALWAIVAVYYVDYSGMWGVFMAVLLGVGAFAHIRVGTKIIIETGQMKPVAPSSKHNTNYHSDANTLVRPSDLPPSQQQAELLRGVGTPVQETPPAELLRATNSGNK